MAESSRRTRVLWAGLAAVGFAATVVAERTLVRRDRARPDPDAAEPFGELHGDVVEDVRSADGTMLHVEEWGSGPTLVLVHGYCLDLTTWHYQIADLGRDHRVVAFDARGHGRSGYPPHDRWTIDAIAEDIDAVIDATSMGRPVVLVGHSMGGMAALEYCRKYPANVGSRVAGLVLASTTAADVMGGIVPPVGRYVSATLRTIEEGAMRALAGQTSNIDKLRGRVSNIAYLGARFLGFGKDPSPSKVAYIDKVLSRTPADVVVSLLPALSGMDVGDVLPSIDIPALVAVGSMDKLTPPGAATRLADGIKQAELHVVPDAGHVAMFERPDDFNRRLRKFLARVPGWS